MNLLKNELIKIFKRPHLYILIMLILLIMLAYNIMEIFLTDDSNVLEQYHTAYKNDKLLLENYEDFKIGEPYNDIQERIQLEKYAIDNNIQYNILRNSENKSTSIPTDARYLLLKFFDRFEILIIFVIIYLSYTVVLEEYNTGTIKKLLTKPHKRISILFSKILAIIISTIAINFIMFIFQYLIGGILFGFSSYSLEAINYNFVTNSVETTNLWLYIVLLNIMKLPMYMILISLSFLISLISTNVIFNILFSLVIYIVSTIHILINNFTKYLFMYNWDLSINWFKNNNIYNSLIISVINIFLIFILVFYIFKNKDVQNN